MCTGYRVAVTYVSHAAGQLTLETCWGLLSAPRESWSAVPDSLCLWQVVLVLASSHHLGNEKAVRLRYITAGRLHYITAGRLHYITAGRLHYITAGRVHRITAERLHFIAAGRLHYGRESTSHYGRATAMLQSATERLDLPTIVSIIKSF